MRTFINVLQISLLSLCTTACVTTAKTPEQMRDNGFAKLEACFEKDAEDVARYLETKFSDCDEKSFGGGTLQSTDIWAESKVLDDNTHLVSLVQKANWNKFYMQVAEIRKTQSCSASVTVYGMRDAKNWLRESQSVLDWIEAWNAEC